MPLCRHLCTHAYGSMSLTARSRSRKTYCLPNRRPIAASAHAAFARPAYRPSYRNTCAEACALACAEACALPYEWLCVQGGFYSGGGLRCRSWWCRRVCRHVEKHINVRERKCTQACTSVQDDHRQVHRHICRHACRRMNLCVCIWRAHVQV